MHKRRVSADMRARANRKVFDGLSFGASEFMINKARRQATAQIEKRMN